MPPHDRVAVLGADAGDADLDGRQVTLVRDDEDPAARLRELRVKGWQFVLVLSDDPPPAALAGLRKVAASGRSLQIYALAEAPEPVQRPAVDGQPLPPPEMIRLTAGMESPHRFYQRFIEGGREGARLIAQSFAGAGLPPGDAGTLLDFGCGCGRVLRHWKELDETQVHGTDYNPFLIDWCRTNLPWARFEVNGSGPGLSFASDSIDLAYAISVFTHLREDLQLPWIGELRRILKPGGLLLLTLMGEGQPNELGAHELTRLTAGELVVSRAESSGANTCNAYHPELYIRGPFSDGFEILEYAPGGGAPVATFQDLLLLRRL